LIQDIQLDPVSNVLLHVDFLAIKADEKVTTEIPLILTGESPLEKSGDGIVQLVKDSIEVEALPQDLPHNITVDISVIETLNDTIFVKDIILSDKVTLLDDPEQAIVTTTSIQEEEVEEVPVEAAE
jgi:large subunit ribosomal protein L25